MKRLENYSAVLNGCDNVELTDIYGSPRNLSAVPGISSIFQYSCLEQDMLSKDVTQPYLQNVSYGQTCQLHSNTNMYFMYTILY